MLDRPSLQFVLIALQKSHFIISNVANERSLFTAPGITSDRYRALRRPVCVYVSRGQAISFTCAIPLHEAARREGTRVLLRRLFVWCLDNDWLTIKPLAVLGPGIPAGVANKITDLAGK